MEFCCTKLSNRHKNRVTLSDVVWSFLGACGGGRLLAHAFTVFHVGAAACVLVTLGLGLGCVGLHRE